MKKDVPFEIKQQNFNCLLREFSPKAMNFPQVQSSKITQMLLAMYPLYFNANKKPKNVLNSKIYAKH